MKWTLVVFVLLFTTLLVACNTTPQNAQLENGKQAPPTLAVNAPKVQENANAVDKIKSFFTARLTASWKINYHFSSQTRGINASGDLAQYLKGSSDGLKVRTDMNLTGVQTETFIVDNVVTTCFAAADGWSCTNSTEQPNAEKVTAENFTAHPENYDVVPDGTMTVAGVTASCYKVTEINSTVIVRYCLSSDNKPLYERTETGDVISELTATSFSNDVSDSDFVPPAEATAMPSYGGGIKTNAGLKDPCAGCAYLTGAQKTQCLQYCK